MGQSRLSKERKHEIRNCPVCHQNFSTRVDHKTIYCSQKCYGLTRQKPLKICPVCNKEFKPRNNQTTCSNNCRTIFYRKTIHLNCDNCGKNIEKSPSQIKTHNFCSKKCYDEYQIGLNVGEKHHNWKGGKTNCNGYDFILLGYKHYRSKHRLIMESFLGRKLSSDEIVHHINGNILDNRIENLKIVSRAEHINIHRKELREAFKKRRTLEVKILE